jgi:hypothetical protein
MRAIILLAMLCTCIPAAAEPVPDDAVLAELFTACLDSLVPMAEGARPAVASLSFEPGIEPSATVKTRTEAFLTLRGYALADSGANIVRRFFVSLAEARSVIRRDHGRFRRDIHLAVRVRATDPGGVIVTAGETGRSCSDIIPASSLRATDTAFRFSYSISRRDAGGAPGKRVIASFLVFTAALAWYGFR